MEYETVMGLEVHVELSTKSKLFCSCSAEFGAGPNENVCPACAGMPGVPPVANKRAIELAMIAGKLTNSEISEEITFDKKNYFYPDLPTGYQITQLYAPICKNGSVEIETSAGKKTITLKQIHIEEDAGKLIHDFRTGMSLVDYNRAGVPLIEIVSNPDFRCAEEVVAYLMKLQKLLAFAGVSDCKMQEGSMRCDVNISVREKGAVNFGVRAEVKNMNSYRAIERAIAYETMRHIDAIETKSEELTQQTRGWDDNKGITFPMRSKEDAHDYRYFPNPEIAPVKISGQWLESVVSSVPETAGSKYDRYLNEFGLSEKECGVLTSGRRISEVFEKTVQSGTAPKEAANWVLGELLSVVRAEKSDIEDLNVDCFKFAQIISLVKSGRISRGTGKTLLQSIIRDNGFDIEKYIAENNLCLSSNVGELEDIIAGIIKENPKSVEEYKNGNEKVITFFVGQVMKKTAGKADPKSVNAVLSDKLKGL